MYHIDSTVDKPDIQYLYDTVKELMRRGVRVDNLKQAYTSFMSDCEKFKLDIQSKYGIQNPNSSVQVVRYLKDLSDPDVVECCVDAKGKWTTDRSALDNLSKRGYDIAKDLLLYRKAKKYADSIKSLMDSVDGNGLIHPFVSLTKTNRISYSSPALMNIPKDLLWYLIKPLRPDDTLFSVDIKNQEPNILINMNNIEELKPALNSEAGLYEYIFSKIKIPVKLNFIFNRFSDSFVFDNDELRANGYHPSFYTQIVMPVPTVMFNGQRILRVEPLNIACPIGEVPKFPNSVTAIMENGTLKKVPANFQCEWTQELKDKVKSTCVIEVTGELEGVELKLTPEVRKEFKMAWNAITYGASKPGVKAMCRTMNGEFIFDFITGFQGIGDYRKKCARLANKGVSATKTYFGTLIYLEDVPARVRGRQLMDAPIQGTGSDLLSLLVKHCNEELKNRGLSDEVFLYYTRHDELIIEVSKKYLNSVGVNTVIDLLGDLCEHCVDDWNPFKVEIKEIKADWNQGNFQYAVEETE